MFHSISPKFQNALPTQPQRVLHHQHFSTQSIWSLRRSVDVQKWDKVGFLWGLVGLSGKDLGSSGPDFIGH